MCVCTRGETFKIFLLVVEKRETKDRSIDISTPFERLIEKKPNKTKIWTLPPPPPPPPRQHRAAAEFVITRHRSEKESLLLLLLLLLLHTFVNVRRTLYIYIYIYN